MWKQTLFSIGAALAAMVIIGGIGSANAEEEDIIFTWDPDVTTEVGGEDVYLWSTPANWDPSGPPDDTADQVHINHSGAQRAVVNYDTREIDGVGNFDTYIGADGDGTLDVLDGGFVRLAGRRELPVIGQGSGNTGTLNQYGGVVQSHAQAIGSPTLGVDGGSGIYNLMGGTLDLSHRARINVGHSGGGSSEFNITGGTIDGRGDSQGSWGLRIGVNDAQGTFNVAGSGAESIELVAVEQGANGTLQFGIDAGGITPIEVLGGTVDDSPGNVIFHDGALLDVGWLDGIQIYGTWTVMEWEDDLLDGDGNELFGGDTHLTLDDVPLAFAPGVDTDIWSVDFYDTGASGYMTVTAIPEPSSLVLLGLAGLLLMKRRRV